MSPQTDFPLVFEKLKSILKPYEKALAVKADSANTFYLDGPYSEKWKKELFFGSAQIKKNYVSFYLMPVYMYPDLLKDISPELKRHMQGKSCFNFKKVEPELFQELEDLAKKSYERFQKKNYQDDIEGNMKFKLELPINKPRAEVWKAFDNVENMKKWQPTLTKFEPVSGTPGQVGAVSKLTYDENGREFALIEKITRRDEPKGFDGVYENNFADNIIKNTFVEQGKDQTLWVMETEFKFKTLLMKIMGPMMKKSFVTRTQKDMERFKEMAESL